MGKRTKIRQNKCKTKIAGMGDIFDERNQGERKEYFRKNKMSQRKKEEFQKVKEVG